MFKFFKKAKEEPTRRQEEIPLADVLLWLESHEIRATKRIFKDSDKIFKQIESEKETIKQTLSKLEQAKLKNDKIPAREMQFMVGNREVYIKGVEKFLHSIVIPESDDELSATDGYHQLILDLGKQTARPYHILQNFFANESGKVAKGLKNMDGQFEKLRALKSEFKFEEIPAVKKEIEMLNSKIRLHDRKRKNLLKKQETLSRWQDESAQLEKDLKEIKKVEEYDDAKYIIGLADEAKKVIQAKEIEFRSTFSPMEAALKKYVRIQYGDDLVTRDYLANPLNALKRDLTLKIVIILGKLKKAIEEGAIELKQSKKQKTLSLIDKHSEQYFKAFLSVYNDDFKRKLELEKSIEKNKILNKEKKLSTKVLKFDEDISRLEAEIDALQNDIEKLQIEETMRKIETRLSDITDVNLTLTG